MRGVAAGLLLALLLTSSGAIAQGVEILEADSETSVRPGESAELLWVVAATDGEDHFVTFQVSVPGANGWTVEVEPKYASLTAGSTHEVVATVQAAGDADPLVVDVMLTVEDKTTGATIIGHGTVNADGYGLILGRWENPMPYPLDGSVGTFAVNVVAWTIVGLLVMWALNPSIKMLTARTATELDDNVVKIISRPAFYLVFAFGFKQSSEALPLPTWVFQVINAAWQVILVALIVYTSYRLWNEVVLAIGRRAAKSTESNLDDRLLPVLEKMGGIVIVLVGFFYLADSFGWNMTWLAAGGAIGGLVIAFAAQDTLGNFFSGLHLLIDRPFAEGDDVILDTGEVCTVKRIGLRSTDLYHGAMHQVIIVPNSVIAGNRIINILKPDHLYKVRVDVGVAYGTDVQKVKQILLDIARGHPLSLDEEGHEPFVRFNQFGDSSLDFSVTTWIEDVYARFAVASDLRELIEQKFAEEGIEIPFPQRVMWHGREEAERLEPGRQAKDIKVHGTLEEATAHLDDDHDHWDDET